MKIFEYLTPDRNATTIRMNRKSFKSFLILEGEDDWYIFRKFVDPDNCNITVAFGVDNVIETVSILNSPEDPNILGIIDSDFRRIDNELPNIDNLILTDHHDLEISVVTSKALSDVLEFHIQKDKFNRIYSDLNDYIDKIFGVLNQFSKIKLINKRMNWGLTFKPKAVDGKQIDFSKFIEINTLSIAQDKIIIKTIFDYCNGKSDPRTTNVELEESLGRTTESFDMKQLVNGHDFISIVCLSLRKHVSNLNATAVSSKQIQRELYLAYTSKEFVETSLYKDIKAWEGKKNTTLLAV